MIYQIVFFSPKQDLTRNNFFYSVHSELYTNPQTLTAGLRGCVRKEVHCKKRPRKVYSTGGVEGEGGRQVASSAETKGGEGQPYLSWNF